MRMYSFTSYTERTSSRRDKFYITPNQDKNFGTNINNMPYNNNMLLNNYIVYDFRNEFLDLYPGFTFNYGYCIRLNPKEKDPNDFVARFGSGEGINIYD